MKMMSVSVGFFSKGSEAMFLTRFCVAHYQNAIIFLQQQMIATWKWIPKDGMNNMPRCLHNELETAY